MNKLKTGLLAAAGIAVGVVTLRKLRQRRNRTPADEAVEEATDAAQHAKAAIEHAKIAGEKSIETVRDEFEDEPLVSENGDDAAEVPARRLRRVGKGWMNR